MIKDVLYSTAATSVGGRDGHVKSEDGFIDMDLRTPGVLGGKGGATNPEELFAAGYSACFNSALNMLARMKKLHIGTSEVKVIITLGKDAEGNFELRAKIDVNVPGVSPDVAKELAHEAHNVCPYSRATRGNIEVEINATAKDK